MLFLTNLLEVILKYRQQNSKMSELNQHEQVVTHSLTAKTLVQLSPMPPSFPISPKNLRPNPIDGYFLDEIMTFRKKCIEKDQSTQEQTFNENLKRKQDKSKTVNDPKIAEQRAKTQLFEYSEQVIRKQLDSVQVQDTERERLPNLSTRLSAFKQQQNCFLKQLLRKKCKQKFMRYNYQSKKSISTQISCQKVWLKQKRTLVVESKSSTKDLSIYHSQPLKQNKIEQISNLGNKPQERLKLCRKEIVISLNRKNPIQSAEQRLERIHFGKFKKERYRKQLKFATASHQELNNHPISLILNCKTKENQDFIHQIRQKRTNSQNDTSSIKSLAKENVVRIRSTNSEYRKQEKQKLLECLNILQVKDKKPNKKLKQIPQKPHLLSTQGWQTKTKNKIMSIFKKIKEKLAYSKSDTCSPKALLSSIKIDSKQNLRQKSFDLNMESTKGVEAKSSLLKKVKQNVNINRRNIVISLKIFAQSKKSKHFFELFSQNRNKLNSSSRLLLRNRKSVCG